MSRHECGTSLQPLQASAATQIPDTAIPSPRRIPTDGMSEALPIRRDQALGHRRRRGLTAAANAELAEDRRHVVVDRLHGEEEPRSDFRVAEATDEQLEHLDLARGEAGRVPRGRRAGTPAPAP